MASNKRSLTRAKTMSTPGTDPAAGQAMSIENLSRDIEFSASLCGSDFRFQSTWGLFSPRGIDDGTELLLDYLKVDKDAHCIDLGCGYGPIGLAMARMASLGKTHLIDKDFVAVEYAARNAAINDITNVDIYLSNGFKQVPDHCRFDLVVSNLPAKAGKELYYLYFLEAHRRMNDGAAIYLVTVNGLRDFVKRVFREVFGNYSKLKQGKNYTVAVAHR